MREFTTSKLNLQHLSYIHMFSKKLFYKTYLEGAGKVKKQTSGLPNHDLLLDGPNILLMLY